MAVELPSENQSWWPWSLSYLNHLHLNTPYPSCITLQEQKFHFFLPSVLLDYSLPNQSLFTTKGKCFCLSPAKMSWLAGFIFHNKVDPGFDLDSEEVEGSWEKWNITSQRAFFSKMKNMLWRMTCLYLGYCFAFPSLSGICCYWSICLHTSQIIWLILIYWTNIYWCPFSVGHCPK